MKIRKSSLSNFQYYSSQIQSDPAEQLLFHSKSHSIEFVPHFSLSFLFVLQLKCDPCPSDNSNTQTALSSVGIWERRCFLFRFRQQLLDMTQNHCLMRFDQPNDELEFPSGWQKPQSLIFSRVSKQLHGSSARFCPPE